MVLRSFLLLVLALAASVAATWAFGDEVLLALSFILLQIKLLLKAAQALSMSEALVWLKAHAAAFFRVELLKKWINVSLVPMVLGRPLLRRISGFVSGYTQRVTRHFGRLLAWYGALTRIEKVLMAAILLSMTLALSVTTIGLWLVLFSVKLPLWVAAVVAVTLRTVVASVEKTLFRTIAFLQLNWLWKGVRWLLPEAVKRRKRRFDYRVLRAVVRRRRMTVAQLAARKDSLPFRLSLALGYLLPVSGGSQDPQDKNDKAQNDTGPASETQGRSVE